MNNRSLSDLVPYIGDNKRIIDSLELKGLEKGRAKFLASLLEEDWKLCDADENTKIWALERGFLPSRVRLYNLDSNNYKDYLSDLDYFLLHPLNNHFAIWINDKLTLKYIIPKVLHTMEGRLLSVMPEYYLYIENDGRYSYLMDSPSSISRDEDYLLNLLKEKKILALKPSNGAGGHGFVKLEYESDMVYANSTLLSKNEYKDFINTLNGYIVTDFVSQHKQLDLVWNNSACTLRVIAIKRWNNRYDGGDVDIIVSYARFGTKKSNGASNLSSGGVAIPYNFNTGEFGSHFYQYLKYAEGGKIKFEKHPDSNISLAGKILPHWDIVRDVVLSICGYLSSLTYFGFDIIVTDDGVKMCEINTHPSLDYEQAMCGPVLANPKAREFFDMKMKDKLHCSIL